MPPRIQTPRLPQPVSCQCQHSRPESTAVRPRRVDIFRRGIVPHPHRDESTENTGVGHGSTVIKHRPLSRPNSRSLQRRNMLAWLTGPGQYFRDPFPGSTNYLGAYDLDGELARLKTSEYTPPSQMSGSNNPDDASAPKLPKEGIVDLRPFPLNKAFQSQPVLSEELREQIYRDVVVHELDIEDVAGSRSVDVRRVAAVVRLKTVERQWLQSNKKMATPYARAVMAMLPQTPLNAPKPHESINDLPVHPKTRQQLFYPASESRQFTREDAAKAFADDLLPADQRIPLPKLIKSEKMILEGKPREERLRALREDNEREAAEKAMRAEKRKAWEKRTQTFVPTNRWIFKFQDVGAQRISPEGRSQTAVGARYGWPHEDRKRGMIKIPTSVE